jgi:predicted MFS family arabinose efflux permease
MMMAGMGILAVGMLAGGFLPFYAVLVIAMFLAGLGKSIFDPALQAYVGEKVPYNRRGTVIGLIETSWAGAALVGIPLAGVLIDRLGWRAPFFMLGGLALLGVVALALVIPKEKRRVHHAVKTADFMQSWHRLRGERAALGMLAFGVLISIANDNLFVVYGAWLENSFALGLVALGTATTVIGIAELAGEGLTATLSDKLGLKQAVTIGLTCSSLSYLLLPVIGQTLPLALTGLFVIFIAFEFTIVTSFSLVTEILPGARATMTSSYVAATGIGRVIGALIGGAVWLWGGLLAIGLISAGLTLLALALFLWGLQNWRATE